MNSPLTKAFAIACTAVLALMLAASIGANLWAISRAGELSGTLSGRIDLNRADAADLIGLAEIDAILAERIVAERLDGGDYCSAADVDARVRGIGPVRRQILADACLFRVRCQ